MDKRLDPMSINEYRDRREAGELPELRALKEVVGTRLAGNPRAVQLVDAFGNPTHLVFTVATVVLYSPSNKQFKLSTGQWVYSSTIAIGFNGCTSHTWIHPGGRTRWCRHCDLTQVTNGLEWEDRVQ